MTKLQKLKQRALKNPKVREEYEALEGEFDLISQLLSMRTAAGLTQEEVASRMGTRKSNICRLEKGNTNPGWTTLKNYAKACGFDIQITTQLAR
jgi:DNA-binding XRE family transcriptional regulator